MLWITLEGLDGCGKSTQSALLAERLNAVLTREPGGTALGSRLRTELLHAKGPETVSDITEMLLYAADRSHHLSNVVLPALDSGVAVVSDRSVWSSVAYQGFGRELTPELVIKTNDIALGGVWPDAVVYIDATATSRKGRMDRELDRIESAGEEFFIRTETGFRLLAATHNWVVVDGDATVDEVHNRILEGLSALLGDRFDLLAGTNGDGNGK
jgi:dTMP kinase